MDMLYGGWPQRGGGFFDDFATAARIVKPATLLKNIKSVLPQRWQDKIDNSTAGQLANKALDWGVAQGFGPTVVVVKQAARKKKGGGKRKGKKRAKRH